MTEQQYEHERAALRATYGDSSTEATAKRDQAMALLFIRSNWTQEELAKKERISKSSADRRLRFGRFLNFPPIGGNAEYLPKKLRKLTEGTFRNKYWDHTEGSNERQRFIEVQRLIADDLSLRQQAKPSINRALIEAFADGKWHSLEAMAKHLDTSIEHVKETLYNMNKLGRSGGYNKCKQIGKSFSYQIFRKERMISSQELTTKLGPIIDDLKAEGKKNMATMSPTAVAQIARTLEKILDTWIKEPY